MNNLKIQNQLSNNKNVPFTQTNEFDLFARHYSSKLIYFDVDGRLATSKFFCCGVYRSQSLKKRSQNEVISTFASNSESS